MTLQPARIAARAVPTMVGYRMPPAPGLHRGLPSPYLTLVFSLSGALPIEMSWRSGSSAGWFGMPVGGLHTAPVLLPQHSADPAPATQRGIQLAVHPFAARALFGVPAAALGGEVVDLGQLTDDRRFEVLLEPGTVAPDAVALVNGWLQQRLAATPPGLVVPELRRAWQLITGSGGTIRVSQVAAEVGWSRRHLTAMMRAEIGVGVKDLARLTRFGRSRSLLSAGRCLSDVAADCGYVDQSHLTAEWRQFAGCTPGQWIAEELPSLTG